MLAQKQTIKKLSSGLEIILSVYGVRLFIFFFTSSMFLNFSG